MTILLTAQDPALIEGLRDLRPACRVLPLGAAVPEGALGEPLRCFVDWLTPDTSGLEMVRRLREAPLTRNAHITMVLEQGDAEERRRALRAGADDYMIGPLTLQALTERLDRNRPARLDAAPPRRELSHGELAVDLAAHQLRFRGVPVPLRPNEFRLLVHFIENPDRVYSRSALIDQLGKDDDAIDERTVDVWIGRLRRALQAHGAENPIRTVRSLGYVLDSVD